MGILYNNRRRLFFSTTKNGKRSPLKNLLLSTIWSTFVMLTFAKIRSDQNGENIGFFYNIRIFSEIILMLIPEQSKTSSSVLRRKKKNLLRPWKLWLGKILILIVQYPQMLLAITRITDWLKNQILPRHCEILFQVKKRNKDLLITFYNCLWRCRWVSDLLPWPEVARTEAGLHSTLGSTW